MSEPIVQDVPQQPLAPVQPPVEPKKKSGFKTIVILLIVILLIAGGVYAGMQIEKRKVKVWVEPPLTEKPTKTPPSGTPQVFTETIAPKPSESVDKTADWKTYTSKNLSVEFKYPPDYSVEEMFGGIFFRKNTNDYPKQGFMIDVSNGGINLDSLRNISEEEAIRQSRAKLISEKDYLLGINDSITGKLVNTRQYLDSGGTQVQEDILFSDGKHTFIIILSSLSPDKKELVYQILSTFKFTN